MNKKRFRISDLKLVRRADPQDVPYVKVGATVWLRSGSPPMTVAEVEAGKATVSWEYDGEKASGAFPVECLTVAPAGSARPRMIAKIAAGCFRQWKAGQTNDDHYNDSEYLWWLKAEDIIAEWGFAPKECDQAWKDFLDRHKGRYPGGNWQPVEKAFLDSLPNAKLSREGDNQQPNTP